MIESRDGNIATYDKVMRPKVKAFMEGVDQTIFVYGQTGSGKTHSLFGPPKFFNLSESEWGMCPKTIDSLLTLCDDST